MQESPTGGDRDWQRVLGFWFGPGDRNSLAERHRRLWFPQEHGQAAADEAVISRFAGLLQLALEGHLDHWSSAPHSSLALIIVLDQFPRHLHRHAPNREELLAHSDSLALQWCRHFISRRPGVAGNGSACPQPHAEQRQDFFFGDGHDPADLYQTDWTACLTVAELGFALLPLRHCRKVPELRLAMTLLDERAEESSFQTEHLERLRSVGLRNLQLEECRASNKSIQESQDLFDQAQDASRLTPAELSHLVYSGINGFASKNEEDAEMSSLSFGASSPLSPSPSPMRVDGDSHSQRVAAGLRSVPHTQFRNHLVSQNLRRFAQRHDIPMEVSGGLLELRKLEQRCLDDLQHDGTRREALTDTVVCISLSGGVDSMVICELLDYFRFFPFVGEPFEDALDGERNKKQQKHRQRQHQPRLSRWKAKKQRLAQQPAGDSRNARQCGKSEIPTARLSPAESSLPTAVETTSRESGCENSPDDEEEDGLLRPLHRPMFRLVAVHVDYGNREQSAAEAAFLEQWCGRRRIPLRVHRIEDGLRRGHTNRDDYERLTRRIRFGLYRETLREHAPHCRGVIFGHHRGDAQENILANVFKGSSLLELNGMSEVSILDGVPIWRPLLALDKSAIFDLAHGVQRTPYFKDTTPTYCTRGRTRNDLVPLLKKVYGPDVLDELSQLGAQSEQWRRLVWTKILRPFIAAVRRGSSDWLVLGAQGAVEPFDPRLKLGPETVARLRKIVFDFDRKQEERLGGVCCFQVGYVGHQEELLDPVTTSSSCAPADASAIRAGRCGDGGNAMEVDDDDEQKHSGSPSSSPPSPGSDHAAELRQFEEDELRLAQIGSDGPIGTCVWLDLRPWRRQSPIVWHELLRRILHGVMGAGMVRHQGLDTFLRMLRDGPGGSSPASAGEQVQRQQEDWIENRCQWMTLRSGLRIRLERGILYIFWPELFPLPNPPRPAQTVVPSKPTQSARRIRTPNLEPTIDVRLPPGLVLRLGQDVVVVPKDEPGDGEVFKIVRKPQPAADSSLGSLRAAPWTLLLERTELQHEFMVRDQDRCSLHTFARTGCFSYLLPACEAGYRLAPGPIVRDAVHPLGEIDTSLRNALPVVDCNLSAQQLLCRHLNVPSGGHADVRAGADDDRKTKQLPPIAEVWDRKPIYPEPERLFVRLMKRRGQGRDRWWEPEFDSEEARNSFQAHPWCVRVTAVFAHPPKHGSQDA